MFPGGQQIKVQNGDSEEEFIEDQNDLDLGLPVDPINRHFAVSIFSRTDILTSYLKGLYF